jgi:hypothetical protein
MIATEVDIKKFFELTRKSGDYGCTLHHENKGLCLGCDSQAAGVSNELDGSQLEDAVILLASACDVIGDKDYKPCLYVKVENEFFYCLDYMYVNHR